jgi:hypothetical protein
MARAMNSKQALHFSRIGHTILYTVRTLTVVGVLSTVGELVIGTAFLVHSEASLLKWGAGFLVILGLSNSVLWAIASITAVLRPHEIRDARDFLDEKVSLNHPSFRQLADLLASSDKELYQENFAQTVVSASDGVTSRSDPLSKQAFFFYAGLLAGLLGTVAAMYGLASNLYPSTLAGSIIASIGFVTLACALISAEDASESESPPDGRSEQYFY